MSDFKLDFIGLGAAKAGTTWIGQCLAEHPGICMSDPKEVNFFGHRHVWPPSPTHYEKGLGWLEKQFPPMEEGQVRGEYSVGYLIDPDSPALIRKDMPEARLLISLRNPIDGLYSFYFELLKQYVVPETFEGLLEEYPDFIDYGDYALHVQRFLDVFPREQFHILLYDDIRADAAKVLRELFSFIGADPGYEPPSLTIRVNERAEPKLTWLRDAIGGTRDFLRTTPAMKPLQETLRVMGGEKLANWVQKKNLQPMDLPPMEEETRERLRERYAEGNRALGAMLGRDLGHWN